MFREISLHILDIAENSIQAGAKNVSIKLVENHTDDRLQIIIIDDGKGMDKSTTRQVINPFVTSRTTRKVGLGLPFFKEAAEACNGFLKIHSAVNKGTKVHAEFQLSHIDRMPLGDIQTTFVNLLVGYPQSHWIFQYQNDNRQFYFDDHTIKKELADIPLTEPSVLKYLQEYFETGLDGIISA